MAESKIRVNVDDELFVLILYHHFFVGSGINYRECMVNTHVQDYIPRFLDTH